MDYKRKIERKIELSLGRAGWLADFKGNQEIKRLFGTTKIPMPFTEFTPAHLVQEAVQFLNPGAAVVVVI
jgi:hypothetical protein